MSRISRTRGKNAELAIAGYMQAKRNHFESEDPSHPIFSIECKHRKTVPALIRKAMAQAEAAAPGEKIPIVVLHEERQEYRNSYVVMRLHNLRDLVKKKC